MEPTSFDEAKARRFVAEGTPVALTECLVDNSVIGVVALLDTIPIEESRRVIEVKVHGVLLGMHGSKAAVQAPGGGSIANVSSIHGLVGTTNMTNCSASRVAVTVKTRSAALELGRLGNRVKSIHRGVGAGGMSGVSRTAAE